LRNYLNGMLIGKILHDTYARLIMVSASVVVTMLIIIQVSNDILIWLLDPIREINNDFHNKIIWDIINNEYDSFDIDKCRTTIRYTHSGNEIDFIPSYELSVRIEHVSSITYWVVINSTALLCYIVLAHNVILSASPSLFGHERNRLARLLTRSMLCICASIFMTHNVWTIIYWQISLHNYYAYNYYEVDVIFDMHDYVTGYVKTVYLTIFILMNERGSLNNYIILSLWVLGYDSSMETAYFYVMECAMGEYRKWIDIMRSRLSNLSNMER